MLLTKPCVVSVSIRLINLMWLWYSLTSNHWVSLVRLTVFEHSIWLGCSCDWYVCCLCPWGEMQTLLSVVNCSLMNEVVQTSPTIGSNVEEIVWKNIRFIMWDIGGQESLRNTWNSYFTNTKVCREDLVVPILLQLLSYATVQCPSFITLRLHRVSQFLYQQSHNVTKLHTHTA